jgi:hypothetical protein
MKPVDMARHGAEEYEGDCLMACVASILELDLTTLPVQRQTNADYWLHRVEDVALRHGYRAIALANEIPIRPPGYAIACGVSPRSGGQMHAVVALDGDVVHDPHPTRDGIESVTHWVLFIPTARVPYKTSQTNSDVRSVL